VSAVAAAQNVNCCLDALGTGASLPELVLGHVGDSAASPRIPDINCDVAPLDA
jgi:hypothetical protein